MRMSIISRTGRRSHCRRKLITVVIMAIIIGFCWCSGVQAEDVAQKAFNLRISGKVDEARTLLEKHLAQNSDDASAHYELARINYYSGIGKPAESKVLVAMAGDEISRAVEIAPNNVIYRAFSGQVAFLTSYMALKSDVENAKEHVGKVCKALEEVLELEPDYGEIMLNLVEIYGGLPEAMGGDKAKAEEYVKKLEGADVVLNGKAHAIMMPEDADVIGLWKEIVGKHPHNSAVLEEMGKVFLRQGKTNEGIKYLEAAIAAEPDQSTVLLDLARYHLFTLRQKEGVKETAVPAAEDALNRYLATDPIAPLKAFALGLLGKLKYYTDEKEMGDKLVAEAEAIDAYFSKASAIPHPNLFVPPDELPHNHTYMLQPF